MIATQEGQPALIDCRTAALALYDFLDGPLTDGTMASVRHHIDLCAECAPHFDFARRVIALLPSAVPLDASTAALRARIVASLKAEGFQA